MPRTLPGNGVRGFVSGGHHLPDAPPPPNDPPPPPDELELELEYERDEEDDELDEPPPELEYERTAAGSKMTRCGADVPTMRPQYASRMAIRHPKTPTAPHRESEGSRMRGSRAG